MTIQEFSDEFDVLLNSFASKTQFGSTVTYTSLELDEYEKSVYLTRAQEEIVKEYYSGKNPFRESFDQTEEIKRIFLNLESGFSTRCLRALKNTDVTVFADNSYLAEVSLVLNTIWFITLEWVVNPNKNSCESQRIIPVIPITLDEYHKIKRNPFRGPAPNRILRVNSQVPGVHTPALELIWVSDIKGVPTPDTIVYYNNTIRKPKPIILTDLPEHLSINNTVYKTECELHSIIHRPILERAVELAYKDRGIKQTK